MFARLWWKDARQYGPAWLLIVLASLAGFLLGGRYVADPEVRSGFDYAITLMGSCLYALAIATAALAGERENRTLRSLDTLPAPRGRLWDGKASFATVTAFALSAVLIGIAAWRTDPEAIARAGGPALALGVAALVLEAVGWGLLWSSLLNHVLAAAVLAVCCLLLLVPLSGTGGFEPDGLARGATIRLVVALLTAVASRGIFLASGPPQRTWWVGRRVRRARRAAATDAASSPMARPRRSRPTWPRTTASLAWQATREARAAWPMLALLGLGVPFAVQFTSALFYNSGVYNSNDGLNLAVPLNLLVALLAGVGVFHAEHRGHSFRFLAHHGVRPALIWPIKVAAWLLALGLLWAFYAALLLLGLVDPRSLGPMSALSAYAIALAGCFASGLLCGMAIRRGITAALVAVLVVIAVVAPIAALTRIGLMSWLWASLVPPLALAVSWAWTGPWLLDRPGAGRWLRLAGLLAAAVVLLLPAYLGSRAWGVPDLGPMPDALRDRLQDAPIAEDDNAAPLYRMAEQRMIPPGFASRPVPGGESGLGEGMADGMLDPPSDRIEGRPLLSETPDQAIGRVIQNGWDPEAEAPEAWLRTNAEVLELLRDASRRPRCRFSTALGPTTFPREPQSTSLFTLSKLLAISVRDRQHGGDLQGAWDDLMALFRMARQPVEPRSSPRAIDGLMIEQIASALAMAWALDDAQTPDRLRDALGAYRSLGEPPDLLLVIAGEQRIAEETLAMPLDALRDLLIQYNSHNGMGRANQPDEAVALYAAAISTPWELERARRAVRTLFEAERRAASRPGQSTSTALDIDDATRPDASSIMATTPLAQWVFGLTVPYPAYDQRTEVTRRALVQVLAIRAWQLDHEGHLPDRLEELVPSEVDRLPDDPYRPGQPFGYVRSDGQPLPPIGMRGLPMQGGPLIRHTHGDRLLYSVGPDRIDNQGLVPNPTAPAFGDDVGDLVFPLPDPHAPPPAEPAEPPDDVPFLLPVPDIDPTPPIITPEDPFSRRSVPPRGQ